MRIKLLPDIQEYYCPNGHFIKERRRKPCKTCGSMNRIIGRTTEDGMGVKDKA